MTDIFNVRDHSFYFQLKKELKDLQSSDMWSSATTRESHWTRCQDLMEMHQVAAPVAAKYFMVCFVFFFTFYHKFCPFA
jgi:hypothetical protein